MAAAVGIAKSYAELLFKFPAIGNVTPTEVGAALAEPAQEEGAGGVPTRLSGPSGDR